MTAIGVLVGLLAAAWAVAVCLSRVRRLHRLHIRVDAARAGLDVALARRAAVAAHAGIAIPDGSTPGPQGPRLDPDRATDTPTTAAFPRPHPPPDPPTSSTV